MTKAGVVHIVTPQWEVGGALTCVHSLFSECDSVELCTVGAAIACLTSDLNIGNDVFGFIVIFFFTLKVNCGHLKTCSFFFMNNHLIFECGCGEPWIIAMGKLTVKNVYFNVINSIISFLLTIQGYISFKEGLAEQCVASKERVCEGKWSEYAPKILILSQGIHWILIMSWRSPAGRGKTRGVRNLVYHFGLPWFSFYFNYKRRSSLTQLSTTSFIKNLF